MDQIRCTGTYIDKYTGEEKTCNKRMGDKTNPELWNYLSIYTDYLVKEGKITSRSLFEIKCPRCKSIDGIQI